MIATGIIGAGLGVYQTIEGAKERSDAKKALANYNRQTLKNVADDLTISRLGADLQREEQARLSSTTVDALQGSSRNLIAGLGRVEAGNQAVNERIGASLDEKQKEIDIMKANEEANIRAIQEGREVADINALSSQYVAGKDQMYQGIGNTIQGAGMVINNVTTPEGSARREAWREYKKNNPSAKRSDFMKSNPKSSFGGYNSIINGTTTAPSASYAPSYSTSASSGILTRTSGSGMESVNDAPIETAFDFRPVVRRPRMGGIGYSYN